MKKLFQALRDRFDGAEVRDVKFLVNRKEAHGQDVDDLDASLAEVVKRGTALSGPNAL